MPEETSRLPVVAGLDGSQVSVRAARFAAETARRRGVALRLVHASLDVAELLGTRADLTLQSVAASLMATCSPVRVDWTVEQGDPVDVLRSASARASLVVVGGQGAGGRTAPRVGSTAGALASSAEAPVIVLPDNTTSIVVRGRRSVVVGVDGHPSADAVLAFAFAEAAARRTDLVAVHTWRDISPARFETDGPVIDWAAARADEERLLSDSLHGWEQAWPDVVVREVIARGRAASSLLAAGLTAELLVIGHRRRGPFATLRSTTRAVLRQATGPVAVVPIRPGGQT
ncbi:universal stress protein [Candidatus Blastococcus massiliensis]|uniref:universal stress protein n=1 Tax=Candidatus Blastococcus massiliensis TaxID=1470358 RepID=UPI00058BD432|nr:universal stress protein [Candidatus Blastococcus massiliensis]